MASKRKSKAKSSTMKKPLRRRNLPMSAQAELMEAQLLCEDEEWPHAYAVLNELDQRYPRRQEVVELLVHACIQMEDVRGVQRAVRTLIEIAPEYEADWLPELAHAYLLNMHPALAIQTFDTFLQRFPQEERAEEVRQILPDLKGSVGKLIETLPFPRERMWELATWHDEINLAVGSGDWKNAESIAQKLLEVCPHFAPALNNLSHAQWLAQRPEDAITTAWQVLEVEPQNIHALSNLARYCLLTGRPEEAARWAQKLRESSNEAFIGNYKKAEPLSMLGDDTAVLELYRDAKRLRKLNNDDTDFKHLVAVSLLRSGKEKEARELWDEMLEEPPGLLHYIALENREQLELPVGERFAPWPFRVDHWLEERTIRGLKELAQRASKSSGPPSEARREREEEAMRDAYAAYFEQHPGVEKLCIALLDRGDPQAQQLALMMIDMAQTPALLEAARNYSLSRRGPDHMRSNAAQIAMKAGVLPAGEIRFWSAGQWRDLFLMSFEIITGPSCVMSAGVRRAVQKTSALLAAGAWKEAEDATRAALDKHRDVPSLLNNLAQSLKHQGRRKEALEIAGQLHQQHPDYVFARVTLARDSLENGEPDKADDMLRPLMQSRKLHVSELDSWMSAQIEVFIAQKNLGAAQSWLEMWEGYNEQLQYESPGVEIMRDQIEAARRVRK